MNTIFDEDAIAVVMDDGLDLIEWSSMVGEGVSFTEGYHIELASSFVDTGDPDLIDLDGSRVDLGIYGGLEGGSWDLDGDGYFDYFWPGTFDDVPELVDDSIYDRDDTDASVH